MILAVSATIAVVFASGAFLVLQRDLLRVVIGIVLVSNSSVLFIMSAGLTRGDAPIYPVGDEASVSDPLVQAMALTALVIGSSTAALLLAIVYRLYVSHRSVDIRDVSDAEMRESEALERVNEPEEDPEGKRSPTNGRSRRGAALNEALVVLPAGIAWISAAALAPLDGRRPVWAWLAATALAGASSRASCCSWRF
ncbi:sodium:proton antiporter [Rubrobacter marinus]|uniref:sodium:proton antiporter n=1 Tax=Rubrobacter marinus TaxID=2653852 RepID=UPI001D17F09C|nr:sodium:proton antiporter [Rubrobacter marinus]